MAELRALIGQVARTEATVLVTGPSGSGKELAARAIHEASPRASGPFVALNCGAVPRELLESELFGHERGSFTGAHAARIGRFEAAAGGTLFLDEIGDMPLEMQVVLLRVLEERRFERVGSTRPVVADVRVVSATHRDLEAAVVAGRFREDLFYRLNVFPVAMPALGERRGDIPELVRHFAGALGPDRAPRFTLAALRRMAMHDWPGNVRELRNFIERAAIRFPASEFGEAEADALLQRTAPAVRVVDAERAALMNAVNALAFPSVPAVSGPTESAPGHPAFAAIVPASVLADGPLDLKSSLGELERAFIECALERSGGVVANAARLLGFQRTTLVEKMRRMDFRRPSDAERCTGIAA